MQSTQYNDIPVGTKALILSKFYYGVISKRLEALSIERYFSILYFLHNNSGCSQQFICNNLAIDKTAMVKVMEYLMKAGYIQRQVNPEDRREQFINLTKKGVKHTQEIVTTFDMLDKEIFTNIPKDEKAIFLDVLTKMSSNLQSLPGNDLFFNYKKTKKSSDQKTAL